MKHTWQKTPLTKFPTDSIIGMTFHHDLPKWYEPCFVFFAGIQQHFRLINQGITGSPSSNCPSVHGSVPHPLGRLFRHGDVDGTRPVDGWWSQQNPTGNLLNPWDDFSSPQTNNINNARILPIMAILWLVLAMNSLQVEILDCGFT